MLSFCERIFQGILATTELFSIRQIVLGGQARPPEKGKLESDLRTTSTTMDAQSAVSWGAIAAAAVAAAALSLVLIAFGAESGFQRFHPGATVEFPRPRLRRVAGYIWSSWPLCRQRSAVISLRGYGPVDRVHTNEAFFRDTAHGFIAWAVAVLLSASALSSATAYLANGAAAGISGAASQVSRSVNPADVYVDKLFRPAAAAQSASPASSDVGNTSPGAPNGANPNQGRAEVLRLWTASFHDNNDLSAADRAYVAQVVAARTGLSQADAEKRVNDVITEAKTAADTTRKGAAKLSFWLTAAMLFGALAASLAAVEGGSLRDGIWNDPVLTPRPI